MHCVMEIDPIGDHFYVFLKTNEIHWINDMPVTQEAETSLDP